MGALDRVPVGICGLALGISGIAGLAGSLHGSLTSFCAVVSICLLAIYIARCVAVRGSLRSDLSDPIGACVFCTLPMALMVLSQYMPWTLGPWVLCIGIAIQFCLMALIILRHPRALREDLHACVFVPFVGIAAAGISAQSAGQVLIGTICTAFGIAMAVLLMPFVARRYIRDPVPSGPRRPLMFISIAPFALCTTAAVGCGDTFPLWLVCVLYIIGLSAYATVVVRLPSVIRSGFKPTFSALTFPLVISATSTRAMSSVLPSMSLPLTILFVMQAVLAVTVTLYVLTETIRFSFGTVRDAQG